MHLKARTSIYPVQRTEDRKSDIIRTPVPDEKVNYIKNFTFRTFFCFEAKKEILKIKLL